MTPDKKAKAEESLEKFLTMGDRERGYDKDAKAALKEIRLSKRMVRSTNKNNAGIIHDWFACFEPSPFGRQFYKLFHTRWVASYDVYWEVTEVVL